LRANSIIEIAAMAGGIIIGAVLFISLGGEIPFRFLFGFSAVFVALAFIFSLFMKNTSANQNTGKSLPTSYLQDLKEGVKFIRRSFLLHIILAAMAMGFAAEIAFVNRPMFLEYHIGAQGYVLISLMVLIGGIVGSSFIDILGNKFKAGKLIFVLILLAGAVRIVFALVVPIKLIGGLITIVIYAALVNATDIIFSSLNQKIPSRDMVGRIGTISTTFTTILVALGAFVGGFFGRIVPDVSYIFIYQGISFVVIGATIIFIPSIRKLPKMNEIEKPRD